MRDRATAYPAHHLAPELLARQLRALDHGLELRPGNRGGDPVPIGEIMDGLLEEQAFARGMPIANLVRHWPDIVGSRVAAETAPASLERGIG